MSERLGVTQLVAGKVIKGQCWEMLPKPLPNLTAFLHQIFNLLRPIDIGATLFAA